MGTDGPGGGAEIGVRALKPQADRLYGRQKGQTLRARQKLLMEATLPRLRLGGVDDTFLARRPLWLEVGFGGGEHVLAQIAAHAEVAYVACEVFENGICSLLSRLVPEGGEADAALPDMLRVWDDDARDVIRGLPDGSLSRLFLMFPDPWPKSRHAKRRFVHPSLLPEIARVMVPGGAWRIASDDPTYQAWVSEVLAGQSLFHVPPPATVRPEGWPPTRYEAKALAAGRTPLYWEIICAR